MNQVVDKTESLKQTLLYEIASGFFPAGGKLPSERALSVKYGISRITVRLTLAELQAEGVILRQARARSVVAPEAPERLRAEASGSNHELTVAWILPPDQITNPLIQAIFMVFERYSARRSRINLIFADQLAGNGIHHLEADLAVVFAIPDEDMRRKLRDRVRRLVLLNTLDDAYDYIAPDNRLGGRMMAECLIRHGHRRVAGVNFVEKIPGGDFRLRMEGCTAAFAEAGVEFQLTEIDARRFADPARRRKLVAPALQNDATALVGGCDALAAELCAAAFAAGREIPSELSVIGFDDQFYSRHMLPALTTVKYPAEAIAMHLAAVVDDLCKGGVQRLRKLVPPLLIERDSVGTVAHG